MSSTSADIPSFGSSLLRESPPFCGSTGPGGADLSLSELYVSDRSEDATQSKPFSLLPQCEANEETDKYDNEETIFTKADVKKAEADEDDVTILQKRQSSSRVAREERLQHDLFVLKKLNSSFRLYNEALQDTRSSTEASLAVASFEPLVDTRVQNVALQLDRTDRLLDQYVNLLQHTEKNSRLIFDEFWEGGETVGVLPWCYDANITFSLSIIRIKTYWKNYMQKLYKRPNVNGKDANVLLKWSRSDKKEKSKNGRRKRREKQEKGTGRDLLLLKAFEG